MKKILLIILILSGCQENPSRNEQPFLENFIIDLTKVEVTPENIIKSYFLSDYIGLNNDEIIDLTIEVLEMLGEHIRSEKFELFSYIDGKTRHQLKKISSTDGQVYVIAHYDDKKREYQYSYLLIKESKIGSVLPIYKGEIVIGWITP